MKNRTGYFIREGIRGIFLHGYMSFAAICVTVACLIIVGSLCLTMLDLEQTIRRYESENELVAYVDESFGEAEALSVGTYLNLIPNIYRAVFVSREEALERYVSQQENPELYDGLDASTFRDRYEITLSDQGAIRETVQAIEQVNGVAGVRAHYEISNGFATLRRILRVVSAVMVGVLFLISLLIVSNTVKLALFDRRDEIGIMRMVGATSGFIRWPYVVQGLLIGLFAAVLAFFAEWGLYDLLTARIRAVDSMQLIVMLPFAHFRTIMIIVYAGIGLLVGVFGSLVSIRKFLKV